LFKPVNLNYVTCFAFESLIFNSEMLLAYFFSGAMLKNLHFVWEKRSSKQATIPLTLYALFQLFWKEFENDRDRFNHLNN